jgi:hypothetical protein
MGFAGSARRQASRNPNVLTQPQEGTKSHKNSFLCLFVPFRGHSLREVQKEIAIDQTASSPVALEAAQITCRLREKPVAFAKTRGFSPRRKRQTAKITKVAKKYGEEKYRRPLLRQAA